MANAKRRKTFWSIQVGRRMRTFREAAGVTGAQLVENELVSNESQNSRLESGYGVTLTAKSVGDICDFYGMSAEDKFMTKQMYRRAKEEAEYWEPYSQVMFRDISLLFSLERYAHRFYIYDTLIHGLFQTERHARALHSTNDPASASDHVELRMKRQAEFWGRDPLPGVQLLLPEFAFYGSYFDRHQLDRLIELDERPGIEVR
jgi:transcriptional regulator with XRE-family HTH domain